MTVGRFIVGALAGSLALGALAAQAAPMPVAAGEASPLVQNVQFYYYDDPPPVYYDPPPRRYYGPPQRDYWERRTPPPRGYGPPRGPAYGFYDKETTKDYRRAQKEIYKERVRAWNRANGY